METITPNNKKSPWLLLLSKIPVLRDYLNMRGKPSPDALSILDIAKVAVPALLATLLTVSEQLTKLLTLLPNSSRVIQSLTPTACTVLCIHIITARKLELKEPHSAGFDVKQSTKHFIYRYSESARIAAKILLPPILLLSLYYLGEIAPNIRGRQMLVGYLCRVDGKPVPGAEIEVLNVSSRSAVVAPDITGYDGFFAVQLRTWSGRPRVIRTQSRDCGAEDIEISSGSDPRDHCPAGITDSSRKGGYPIWLVQCPLPSSAQ